MTKSPIIFSLLLAAGCASTDRPAERPTVTPVYASSSAAALAFDPPAAISVPMASLSRSGRAPEAFVGYEEQVTTFAYTHQRDEIREYNNGGTLNRRAYTDRTSVTTR